MPRHATEAHDCVECLLQKQQQDKTQIDELVNKVESLELLIPKIQGENEELIAINRAMKE